MIDLIRVKNRIFKKKEKILKKFKIKEDKTNKQIQPPFKIHPLQQKYIIDPFNNWLNSSELRGLLLSFRKSGKTELITILSMANWIAEDQSRTVIIMTRKQDRARAIVRTIGELLKSIGINGDFGQDQIRLRGGKQPTVLGLTVNSTTKGWHADLLVMDDPVEPTDEYSKALKRRVEMVYLESKHIATRVFVIGQYVSEDDIYRYLELKVPVISFWVDKASQELLEILDLDLNELKTDLRNYGKNYEGVFYLNEQNPFANIMLGSYPNGYTYALIDPSLEGGDFTAITLLKDFGDFIAVKGYCFKQAWYKIDYSFLNCKYLYYEDNITGDQPYFFFKEKGIIAQGFRTTKNKVQRISKLSSLINTNKVRVCESSDSEYIRQIRNWNPLGKDNDDAPDSLAMLLENLQII